MATVTLIHGDGIGAEIMKSAQKVINATKVEIEWEEKVAGNCCLAEFGTDLPIETIASIYQSNLVLKGPTIVSRIKSTDDDSTEITSDVTPALISAFDLYTNMRTAKVFPNLPSYNQDIDLVVFREMKEGLYSGIQRNIDKDTAQSIKQFTRKGCTRFIKSAFEYATNNNRKKITIVHQANKMEVTDGMFLKIAQEISAEYPDITCDDRLFDVICTDVIATPEDFDVIVCPNMYGDVLSKMVSHISGTTKIASVGITGGGALGIPCGIFEPSQDAKPEIAGEGVANPIGAILAGAMMLSYMKENDASNAINVAVSNVLKNGTTLPQDLGGTATTDEVVNAIIAEIKL